MNNRSSFPTHRWLALALATSALFAPSLRAAEEVRVVNLPQVQKVSVVTGPAVQRVSGQVTVQGHADSSGFLTFGELRIPPVTAATGPDDLERFEEIGLLDVAGFQSLTATVAGQWAGTANQAGTLELVLLPDVEYIQTTWARDRRLLLAERVTLHLADRGKGLLVGRAESLPLSFPRYRAWLRNTTGHSMKLHLYLLAKG